MRKYIVALAAMLFSIQIFAFTPKVSAAPLIPQDRVLPAAVVTGVGVGALVTGAPLVFEASSTSVLGVATSAVIPYTAGALGLYLIYQAVTGELRPPTVSLVQEGYSKPSGKAYRYHSRTAVK
jgi:hypothetical protein